MSGEWSAAELNRLKELIGIGMPYREIAAELGRTTRAVNHKGGKLRKKMRIKPVKAVAVEQRQAPWSRASARPSDEQIADRDRRAVAERSLTAEVFGDPEPGRSALDQRGCGR